MQPNWLSVYHIFEPQRRYLVPLFQRPYIWNEEDHWDPLWEDIIRRAEDFLNGNSKHRHFLGAVVLKHLDTETKQVEIREIIDGQQRLTTLQLFLAAFRDFIKQLEDDALTREINRITKNDPLADESESFKVWPTQADIPSFTGVMNAGSIENIRNQFADTEPLIVSCYLFFYGKITEFFSRFDSNEERNAAAWAIHSALRDSVQLVVIDLDQTDDPQTIFETLNARGVPLLPSDLIRNFLLHRARDQKEDMEALYDQYWKEFDLRVTDNGEDGESKFWRIEERQGRLTRPRIDLFFFHYLQYKKMDDLRITRLYQEFQRWWDEPPGREIRATLEDITTHSSVFADFLLPDTSSRSGLFLERLNLMDTSTLYPLLLSVLGPEGNDLSEEEKTAIAIDLESFLVRRMICRLTVKNYNRMFQSILQAVRKAGKPSLNVIREKLLISSEDTTRWPADDEFRRRWLENMVYRRVRADRLVMLFSAIESQMRTHKQEILKVDVPLTLEHIIPEEWEKHWPLGAGGHSPWEGCSPTEYRNHMKHTLGNLTVITQPLNSSISNGGYDKKKDEIIKQSVLVINNYLRDVDKWDEAAITERAEFLFEYAKEIWPRPINN
ncbi:hypothetical protein CEE37_05795 [candidate division LCP-89 bacterium B3_LCP]|uniref:DUF262 domain-containing protein n=1 Tax=candidate division LCP-89 bacterium B3_LCP TaxID=2012998 RepID=A0A532V1U5_UNCL8|nr:MAG: hypothetical protein CEE37_05795 [candidate division LCP-89 bacterium B3_LCP]